MIRKRHLKKDRVRVLVIDEADDLLSLKSSGQVFDIVRCLPRNVQICLSSATMSARAEQIMSKCMPSPAKVLWPTALHDNIFHYYVDVEKELYKLETLCDLLSSLRGGQTFVFCTTCRKVDFLAEKLQQRDITVSVFHAEMDQKERDLVLREFRSGTSRVVITTDLLSRGIDVQATELVINFDLPGTPEAYLHQVGRAGRFGRKGYAITFIAEEESLNVLGPYRELQELPCDCALFRD
jgi:translation initiation factor 4A